MRYGEPAGPIQQNQTITIHSTNMGWTRRDKRPNKRHYNTMVRPNDVQTKSERQIGLYKMDHADKRLTDPQCWTGHNQV